MISEELLVSVGIFDRLVTLSCGFQAYWDVAMCCSEERCVSLCRLRCEKLSDAAQYNRRLSCYEFDI